LNTISYCWHFMDLTILSSCWGLWGSIFLVRGILNSPLKEIIKMAGKPTVFSFETYVKPMIKTKYNTIMGISFVTASYLAQILSAIPEVKPLHPDYLISSYVSFMFFAGAIFITASTERKMIAKAKRQSIA